MIKASLEVSVEFPEPTIAKFDQFLLHAAWVSASQATSCKVRRGGWILDDNPRAFWSVTDPIGKFESNQIIAILTIFIGQTM